MSTLIMRLLLVWLLLSTTDAFVAQPRSVTPRFSSRQGASPTELPDSLADAAVRAASATAAFQASAGPLARCRVDFDTSIGDETYTLLKSSTEFMQLYVSALSYAMIDGAQDRTQAQMIRVAEARGELMRLEQSEEEEEVDDVRKEELADIITKQGRTDEPWQGPIARVYFPDEGSAALARRDWLGDDPKVPDCVRFSSCGGVQQQDISKDQLVLFFCPKASEAESVETILQKSETTCPNLKLTVFVNPNLVDMGVSGFGMAGRMLRERLIDGLQHTYYLRTLAWGALTRQWPLPYSIWQEDADAEGGYRLIKTMERLPSNPEVEDVYDIENGLMNARQSGGVLDQLGDFMNGMMRL